MRAGVRTHPDETGDNAEGRAIRLRAVVDNGPVVPGVAHPVLGGPTGLPFIIKLFNWFNPAQ